MQDPKAMKSMLARGKGDLETSSFNRAWKQAGVSCSVRLLEKSAQGDSAAGIASCKSNPRGSEKSRTDRYAQLARISWPPTCLRVILYEIDSDRPVL